jgi:hypothetical protein
VGVCQSNANSPATCVTWSFAGLRQDFYTVCNTERVTVADTVANREVNRKYYFFESPASTNFTTRARERRAIL